MTERSCVKCGERAKNPVLPLCLKCDLARLANGETAEDIQREEASRSWGVWCITSPGWCCLVPGITETDHPWKHTRTRAEEVTKHLRTVNPDHRYEVRPYVRVAAKGSS